MQSYLVKRSYSLFSGIRLEVLQNHVLNHQSRGERCATLGHAIGSLFHHRFPQYSIYYEMNSLCIKPSAAQIFTLESVVRWATVAVPRKTSSNRCNEVVRPPPRGFSCFILTFCLAENSCQKILSPRYARQQHNTAAVNARTDLLQAPCTSRTRSKRLYDGTILR